MKRLLYILLFAGIIAAMCFEPLKELKIKDLFELKDYYLIGAWVIVLIFPFSMLLASLGKPIHVRNAVMFAIIALIVFFGWPQLFKTAAVVEAAIELKDTKGIFDLVKAMPTPKLGIGAIIAGIICAVGFVLSIIMGIVDKNKKKQRNNYSNNYNNNRR